MVETARNLSDAHRAATDPILIQVGARVREIRESHGWTLEDLVAKINEVAAKGAVDVSTDVNRVLRLEAGHRMNDNEFMWVAPALGVTKEDLYGPFATPRAAKPEAPLNQDAVDQLKRILQLLPPEERYRHFRAADKLADRELTVPRHDGSVS